MQTSTCWACAVATNPIPSYVPEPCKARASNKRSWRARKHLLGLCSGNYCASGGDGRLAAVALRFGPIP